MKTASRKISSSYSDFSVITVSYTDSDETWSWRAITASRYRTCCLLGLDEAAIESAEAPSANSQFLSLINMIVQLETSWTTLKKSLRSRFGEQSNYCWYHRRFDSKVAKCTQLCDWESTKQEN